jgi:uncharacterized RDD family membrane protein YckC
MKRIAALFYDFILSLALILMATGVFTSLFSKAPILLFRLYIILILWLYFAYCWTHGGQTLGAKAWKLILDPTPLSWRKASLRFWTAFIGFASGINFFWWIFDKGNLIQDRFSGTKLIRWPE